jgi:hypothetical protein
MSRSGAQRSRGKLFESIEPVHFPGRARAFILTGNWFARFWCDCPLMSNEVVDKESSPQSEGIARCKQQLGGTMKSYQRDTA